MRRSSNYVHLFYMTQAHKSSASGKVVGVERQLIILDLYRSQFFYFAFTICLACLPCIREGLCDTRPPVPRPHWALGIYGYRVALFSPLLSINPLGEKLSMVHLSYCLDRGLSPNKSSFYNVLESCIRPAALVFKPSCERLNQSGNLSYYHTTRLLINQQLHELCPTSVEIPSFSKLELVTSITVGLGIYISGPQRS